MTDGTQRAPEVTPDLRLRAERPRVTRLSRKVLIGLGGAVGLAVAAALIWALQTRRGVDQAAKELYTTENRTTAEGVTALPRDYTGIPRLRAAVAGRSRPADAQCTESRPARSTDGATAAARSYTRGAAACAGDRGGAIEQAVRLDEFRATPSLPATAVANATSGTTLAVPAEAPPLDPNSMQNMQDRKLAFVNGPVDRRTVSADRLANPASPYVVQAGTVIPAALITGIHSDLPGQVTAQVTEHVYDTPTGKFLLIPQGSRLIGQYDSQIAFGQKRVLLVWNRIMLPDGKSIVLERQQGADAQGFSGLEDEVDYHWWDLAKAAALSTLLGIGTELGSSDKESDLVRALRRGSQDSINKTASSSCAASSTSSRHSPSARASRCA